MSDKDLVRLVKLLFTIMNEYEITQTQFASKCSISTPRISEFKNHTVKNQVAKAKYYYYVFKEYYPLQLHLMLERINKEHLFNDDNCIQQ